MYVWIYVFGMYIVWRFEYEKKIKNKNDWKRIIIQTLFYAFYLTMF